MPTRLILSGETVDASMVRRVTVPKAAVAVDALLAERDIVGRTAVAPIGPNEYFAAWKLADRQRTPRTGERYVSFPTNDVTNVGNMLRRGDRVDVWVEFEHPKRLGGSTVGALKVIEGLLVANVRTAEGAEVTDAVGYEAPFASAPRQAERIRSQANGQPGMNTFIMSEDVYEAYVAAELAGAVKLALPELTMQEEAPARVTEAFRMYREAIWEGEENE